MSNNDISAKVTLNATQANSTATGLIKNMNALAAAGTDAGTKMSAAQRLAAKAAVDGGAKIMAANDKVITSNQKRAEQAVAAVRMEHDAYLKNKQDRANSRTVTASKVEDSGRIATGKIANGDTVANAKAATQIEIAAAQRLNALSREREATQKILSSQIRNTIAIEEAGARRAEAALSHQLAMRKQMFREQQALNRVQDDAVVGLNGMRYLLADISQSMRIAGLAALVLPTAMVATAVSWEREFANVQRTTGITGDAVDLLKGQFVSLVQTMPIAWDQLAEIGSLAGQLGIPEAAIGKFTETVAMFSATTGVTVDMSATAFGRLNALLPDVDGNFAGLGDSILKVGVNSIATEAQIIKISTQIAAIAAPAGFSSQEVIGLSGALASVAVPPELSRGVITRVFGLITKAAVTGGPALEKWGQNLGMSGEEFRKSWNSDAAGTFQKFMDTIRSQGSSAALALGELGITSVRDVPILMRLASAADSAGVAGGLLAQTMGDAKNAGGEMQKQYDIIGGTVASKLQVFVQTFQTLIDAIGSSALPALGDLLDGWAKSLKDLSRNLKEPVELFGMFELPFTVGEALGWAAGILAIVGALGVMVAVLARVVQGSIAMALAMKALPLDMQALGLASVKTAAQIDGAAIATGQFGAKASLGVRAATGLKGALGAIGGPGVMLALLAIPMAIDAINASLDAVGTSGKDVANILLTTEKAGDVLKQLQIGKGGTGNPWKTMSVDAKDFKEQLGLLEKKANGSFTMDTRKFESMRQGNAVLKELNDGYTELIAAGNKDVVFGSVQGLSKDMKLSNDEISRMIYSTPALNSLFKDTLGANGIKASEDNLVKLAKNGLAGFGIEADGATAAGDAFNEELSATQQLATNTIEALMGTAGAFMDFSSAMSAATDEAGFHFDAFMQNIRDQATATIEWQTNMGTLAASGASTAFLNYLTELGPEAAVLIKEFTANPEALAEADALWTQHGGDSAAGWAGAMQAKLALADEVGARFGNNARATLLAAMSAAGDDLPAVVARYNAILDYNKLHPQASLDEATAAVDAFISQQAAKTINIRVRAIATDSAFDAPFAATGGVAPFVPGKPINKFSGGLAYDGGGYTGDGGMYQPAGIVHKGEFVMTKQATTNLGQNYLYNLMRSASKGYATGGTVTGSSNSYVQSFGGSSAANRNSGRNATRMVELSPYDRSLLAAVGNIGLSIDGREVSKTTNTGSLSANRRGSN